MKCFSLTSYAITSHYDVLIVPLLRRMIHLEKLTLYLRINARLSLYHGTSGLFNDTNPYVDGTHLHNNVLVYMPQLHSCKFYISTENVVTDLIHRKSTDDIQQIFTHRIYGQTAFIKWPSALLKKPCAKCNKGRGVTTCDGCQQSFCIKRIIEYRQELATQLDNIGQEHDLFRHDLTQENLIHSLLVRINEWEQESITKIQVVAEAARADLRQLLDQTGNELKVSVDKMINEMQSCRELNDYTETETQLTIEIVENENTSTSIPMIKIPTLTHEKFRNFVERIVLSKDGLMATCLDTYWDGSNVYGIRLYSSETHQIHFRIENKTSHNLFFDIKTTSYDMPVQNLTSPYTYGWWELDQAIEITMTLDCGNRQIRFEHHRINLITHLSVDLEKCPFPWKILVTLRSTDDSVRILL
ncbi:unnamed protein product [Rotaria sp. Silwood2]|nr:unnamed protein product [Rotaria sp. Silwood2]